jgi:succinoglycan biosynthesis transport protein ExoP
MNTETLDIRILLGLLRRRWRIMAICLAIGTAFGLAYVTLKSPVYLARSLVLVDPSQSYLIDQNDRELLNPAQDGQIESEVDLVMTPSVLDAVVAENDLTSNPEFASADNRLRVALKRLGLIAGEPLSESDTMRARAAANLEERVAIKRVGTTYLISIEASSTDPLLAAKLANGLANAYLRSQIDSKIAAALRVRDALSSRLAKASAEIGDTDRRIANFISQNLETVTRSQTGGRVSALRDETATTQASVIALGAKAATVSHLASNQQWLQAAMELGSADATTLAAKREELIASLSEVRPGSSASLAARAAIAETEQQLDALLKQAVEALSAEVEAARARLTELQSETRAALLSSDMPSELLVQLYRLQQDGDASRRLYENLLQRLRGAEEEADLKLADSRVVSLATAPVEPSSPRIVLVMAAALIGSLGAGLAFSFLAEHFIGGFTSEDQLKDVLHIPLVASIPTLNSVSVSSNRRQSVVQEIIDHPLSAYSESLRRARFGAEMLGARRPAARKDKPLVVLVGSALPGEGKTTTAVGIARAFALSRHRTLLIDCDLRRPAVAVSLNTSPTAGLGDFLLHGNTPATLNGLIAPDDDTPLEIVMGNRLSGTPTDNLLTSDRFADLMRATEGHFDVVVLDTPPILPVIDARYLVRYADVALLAVRWASSSQHDVRRALSDLQRNAGGQVAVGAILTRVAASASTYNRKYDDYYSSEGAAVPAI